MPKKTQTPLFSSQTLIALSIVASIFIPFLLVPFLTYFLYVGLFVFVGIPPLALGIGVALYTQKYRKLSKEYTKPRSKMLFVIAGLNITIGLIFYAFMAYSVFIAGPIYDAKMKQEGVESKAQWESTRLETLQRLKMEEAAKAHGCTIEYSFIASNISRRLGFYEAEISKGGMPGYEKAKARDAKIQAERQQSIKDCAEGKITAAEQKVIYDKAPQRIISEYRSMVGEEAFQKIDKEYKDAQVDQPDEKMY